MQHENDSRTGVSELFSAVVGDLLAVVGEHLKDPTDAKRAGFVREIVDDELRRRLPRADAMEARDRAVFETLLGLERGAVDEPGDQFKTTGAVIEAGSGVNNYAVSLVRLQRDGWIAYSAEVGKGHFVEIVRRPKWVA
jgi:hypothetical protein